MRNLLSVIVVLGLVGYGYSRYQAAATQDSFEAEPSESEPIETDAFAEFPEPMSTESFTCDGRTHCSEMSSCAEATYFIRTCPNTKMDGDNDGVPCESQWCQ